MKRERGRLFTEFRETFADPDHTQEDLLSVIGRIQKYNGKIPLDTQGAPNKRFRIDPEDVLSSLRGTASKIEKTYRGVEMTPDEARYFFPYEKRTMPH